MSYSASVCPKAHFHSDMCHHLARINMHATPHKVSAASCMSDCPQAVPSNEICAIVSITIGSAWSKAVMTTVMINVAANIFRLAIRV